MKIHLIWLHKISFHKKDLDDDGDDDDLKEGYELCVAIKCKLSDKAENHDEDDAHDHDHADDDDDDLKEGCELCIAIKCKLMMMMRRRRMMIMMVMMMMTMTMTMMMILRKGVSLLRDAIKCKLSDRALLLSQPSSRPSTQHLVLK